MSSRPRPRISVLGAGSWGTVFAHVLSSGGCEVRLWARRDEVAHEITTSGTNAGYVPGLRLCKAVTAHTNVSETFDGTDGIVLAVPAQSLRNFLASVGPLPDVPVVSLVKGIERSTDRRMSEVIGESGVSIGRIAVLSGPNLAREIAAEQPCASVVASTNPETARVVASWCGAEWFRAYVSEDVVGVEVAGAMKNVIAMAIGAAAGLGYGDNSRASLMTRGLAEMTRLGVALGAQAPTFAGLAGLGDLVATCSSPLSRNFRMGRALGEGLSVAEAEQLVGQTAEGLSTARAVADLAERLGVDAPLTAAVVDVVDGGRDIADVTRSLLARSVRPE